MIQEARPNSLSTWVIDATKMRAQGIRLREVANTVGFETPAKLRSALRGTYMRELGVNNPVAAAQAMDELGILDLNDLSRQYLRRVARLSAGDRAVLIFYAQAVNPVLEGKSLTAAEADFKAIDKDSLANRLKATSPTHLYVMGLAAQTRLSIVSSDEAPDPTEVPTNNILDKKIRSNIVRPLSLHQISQYSELHLEIIGTALTGLQKGIIRLDAEGLNVNAAIRSLGITRAKYKKELNISLNIASLTNGEKLTKSQAKEANSARRIIIANILIHNGIIDPIKIASEKFPQPKDLVNIFNKFTPREMWVINSLSQGKTASSIVDDLPDEYQTSSRPASKHSIEIIISRIGILLGAGTRTHIAVLFEAHKRLQAQGAIT